MFPQNAIILMKTNNFNSEKNPYCSNTIHDSVQIGDRSLTVSFGTKYSRMDQVKFVEDSLKKI